MPRTTERSVSRPDELDGRIIELLQDDGRRPFSEIGRTLNEPGSTIKRRVELLRQRGHILGFTAVLPSVDSNGGTAVVVEVSCPGVDRRPNDGSLARTGMWGCFAAVAAAAGLGAVASDAAVTARAARRRSETAS